MNYIYEFAAVAIVIGITGFFSDKLKGGMGKAVNFTSCLILMLCILTPVAELIKRDGLTGNIPEIGITEEFADEGEYLQKLKELTEDRLTSSEKTAIKNRFGYDEEDIGIDFVGTVESEIYELQYIEISIRSFGALSKRDEIIRYLSEKYLCEVKVSEDIIG